jgi:8-oxo-dGTP diphosphatase
MTILLKLTALSVIEKKLKIFLKAGNLPSMAIRDHDSPDKAAKDISRKYIKAVAKDSYLEQLYTFSSPGKIIVTYYILVPSFSINPSQMRYWFSIERLNKNNKDRQIIKYAIQRLRWKVEYTNVVYSLLPKKFTLSELQEIYEVILGRSLDKRNFRKKILSLGILKDTGEKKTKGPARPAEIYEFKMRKPCMVEVF